jgi:magnesium transporter
MDRSTRRIFIIMVRLLKKASKKAGMPPGALVHVGEKRTERIRIRIVNYDEETLEEIDLDSIDECFQYIGKSGKTWINIDGIHETGIIEKIGHTLHLHPLVLEDILNAEQRPKLDDHEDYLFICIKMLTYDSEKSRLNIENVSLVLSSNYLISLQEVEGDVLEPIRERLRKGRGRIRKMGHDYLAYALLDAIVDNYFTVLEKIGEEIESLEEDVIANPDAQTVQTIHFLKREMIFLRKSVWPLREVVNTLERGESPIVQDSSRVFLRDVYDHTIQIIDTIETFRDMVSGMLDVYLSTVSNRMNQVMKVLTIIATIFIPLTFIVGIYGMNFKHMPELEQKWAYPLVLGGMLLVEIIMVIWFRRKKWL